MKRIYGWKRQLPDFRDLLMPAPTQVLPSSVDLRATCPPIKDQGQLGSCTAHGITSCVEFLEIKDKHPLVMLSRLYLYYNERYAEGTTNVDSGAIIRDGIKVLKQHGCCPENMWPYDISHFTWQPLKSCYQASIPHDLVLFMALKTLQDMKTCLATSFPFVFGFSVYDSFESDAVASTGIVPLPQSNENCLGGHCVYCVGYDDAKQMFLCANSRGTSWGQKGFFQIPYAYLTNADLASDFWTLRKTRSE